MITHHREGYFNHSFSRAACQNLIENFVFKIVTQRKSIIKVPMLSFKIEGTRCMSHRETRRQGVEGSNSHKLHFVFCFCGTSAWSSDRLRCGAVVFQVNFFNQICEVLSGMSCPTHSLHYINLIECRCVHVIRFTFSSFSRVLAPRSEFID